ncbi:MAG: YwaF family protein [Erysipelotrichales bacterium]|nr:YwaF family protein [Erysipelotrichales bacterium]
MYYLLFAISFLLISGLIALTHFKFASKEKLIVERIIPYVLIAIFIVRFMCYKDIQASGGKIGEIFTDYAHSTNGPLSPFLGITANLIMWLEISAILILLLRPFFNFKTAKNMTRFISMPIFVLSIIFIRPILTMMQGHANTSMLTYMFPLEIGFALALSIYYFIKDFHDKSSLKEIGLMFLMFFLINITTMPVFMPRFLFGKANALAKIIDITVEHRLFMYAFIVIIPLVLYSTLKNKPREIIDYSLIIISLGTLTGFMYAYKYDVILQPWNWPFHLCNTAMFLMPICFIFKPKRLFYFTYFINVAGALFAMLMPNYNEWTNAISPTIMHFWFNHAIAFFMPILGVALGVFEKPKLKQFYYSMAWFFGYFVLALVMNVVFTAMGHEVDYFFINSTFIAEKLGRWAENIFELGTVKFTIAGLELEFHPLYQFLFYIVYVLIGVAVWFIYELCYNIADSHNKLIERLKKIKVDQLALESTLNGRSIEEPMIKDAGIRYELIHFSKKYASNKHYSVHDANFAVVGGEIFGFLGPNGAGKSTIIKSTVGIQPISEGNIDICGYDVAKQPVQAKRLIGYVPDHYALYEKLSGREYLNYIADIYQVSKDDRDARLAKYIELFQLEHSIDNKIKTYSHGMKQKITIMAALVHNPKVWILDEPLTGLDPTSIYQVKKCMKQHAEEGNIVFFSSHIIDIVEKLCDRIAIIKKGEIQCVKTVKEIEDSGVTLEQFYLDTIGENPEEM